MNETKSTEVTVESVEVLSDIINQIENAISEADDIDAEIAILPKKEVEKYENYLQTIRDKSPDVTLGTADAWHEVQCPHCVQIGGLVDHTNVPDGCGICKNCDNIVRLVNSIDSSNEVVH